MNPSSALLPRPLCAVLSRLPQRPGSMLFAAGLNLALAKVLPADVLQALHGKRIGIRVTDAGLAFAFTWTGARFAAADGSACDVSIGATAHDFSLLALRQEDPDTLFFSRRLSMEGDTELGLLVKNALDAIDTPLPGCGALGRWLAQRQAQPGGPRIPVRSE
ncbi:sterol-binding protein [Oxalobacteraceae bacterium OM1]|nr:sterol-binding protein [Oxalobacteraceae bacterium OM1]